MGASWKAARGGKRLGALEFSRSARSKSFVVRTVGDNSILSDRVGDGIPKEECTMDGWGAFGSVAMEPQAGQVSKKRIDAQTFGCAMTIISRHVEEAECHAMRTRSGMGRLLRTKDETKDGARDETGSAYKINSSRITE